MPNHAFNKLIASAHVLDALKGTDEDGTEVAVDFNQVIPQPADIGDEWHEWNTQHWSTKWNAYNSDRNGETSVTFETAWSGCEPVIEALSLKFPKEVIEYDASETGSEWILSAAYVNGQRIRYEFCEDFSDPDFEELVRAGIGDEDYDEYYVPRRADFQQWVREGFGDLVDPLTDPHMKTYVQAWNERDD